MEPNPTESSSFLGAEGREAHRRRSRDPSITLALLACGMMLLLHLGSFFTRHREGDELVYLTLAREMNWDLSHYTTRDDPLVSTFPNSIYRQDLFHHPPLFPLVLKVGHALGAPVFVGLVFHNLAMLLLLYFTWRAARLLAIPLAVQPVLYAAMIFCPVLLFSTTRLHHDALAGILLFCGISLFAEALDSRGVGKALGAGLLLALAFNTRYTVLAALPILLAMQIYSLGGRGEDKTRWMDAASRWRNWRPFAVVMLLVLVFGSPHYVRVLLTYGSVIPSSFVVVDENVAEVSDFLRLIVARTPLRMVAYLLLIFPAWLVWFCRGLRSALRLWVQENRWRLAFLVIGAYLVLITLALSHQFLRYFAVAMPFVHLGLPLAVSERTPGRLEWPDVLVALTLFLMLSSALISLVLRSADVVPSFFYFLPFLRSLYL